MDGTDERQPTPPIRLFILDDNEFLRAGLVALFKDLTSDVVVVGQASTAADGLRLMLDLVPDVALLDVELPDGDGISVCRTLRTRCPGVQCLMLTGHDEEAARLAAVLAGASGDLNKGLSAAEILDAVRRVAAGELLRDPPDSEHLRVESAHLSETERRLLGLVVARQTNAQIAAQLSISETAVKTRLSVIFVKIGLERRLRASPHIQPSKGT